MKTTKILVFCIVANFCNMAVATGYENAFCAKKKGSDLHKIGDWYECCVDKKLNKFRFWEMRGNSCQLTTKYHPDPDGVIDKPYVVAAKCDSSNVEAETNKRLTQLCKSEHENSLTKAEKRQGYTITSGYQ